MNLKCLRCGNESIVELNPVGGTTYAISIIDKNKVSNQVQPIRLLVCQSCKKIEIVLRDDC